MTPADEIEAKARALMEEIDRVITDALRDYAQASKCTKVRTPTEAGAQHLQIILLATSKGRKAIHPPASSPSVPFDGPGATRNGT